jgi:soluble lytic murein transglycosylase-like protein
MARFNTLGFSTLSVGFIAAALVSGAAQAQEGGAYSGLVSSHAAAHGLPPTLVHRVIMRESRYNPRAVSKGNYGMMQIRLGTARAMGYRGDASGLLDPDVNMTYAVKYLAGAYRAAGGNPDRAVALYARGYHDVAKRQGTTAVALAGGSSAPVAIPAAAPIPVAAPAIVPIPVAAPGAPVMQPQARKAYNAAYPARYRHNNPAMMVTTARDQEVIW